MTCGWSFWPVKLPSWVNIVWWQAVILSPANKARKIHTSFFPSSWGGSRWPLKSLKLKLSIGISDEIKVATIKFDDVSQEMMAKKVAKKCAACSGFFFLLYKHVAFLFSPFCHHHCGCKLSSRLWVASTLKKILDMWWFHRKPKIWWKTCDKNNLHRYL